MTRFRDGDVFVGTVDECGTRNACGTFTVKRAASLSGACTGPAALATLTSVRAVIDLVGNLPWDDVISLTWYKREHENRREQAVGEQGRLKCAVGQSDRGHYGNHRAYPNGQRGSRSVQDS